MLTRRHLITAAGTFAAAACSGGGESASAKGKIQKSILITMLPEELPLLDRFKLAIECGFHLMEVRTVGDDSEAHAIKDAADSAGLKIHSVMNMKHWQFPLSSPDRQEVETSLQGMRDSLRQAKIYGADAVLLVPAVVRDDTTYAQAWERSQTQIRTLIPEAEKVDVIIAIEEVWNKFLLTSRDFAQYLDEFKHPLIKAYLDIGNMVHYGVPQHWIRDVGERIVKVHLKDYTRKDGFVDLGDGDVNWPEVRQAFADVGYDGAATVELRGGDKAYLADVAQRVDRLLGLSS